MAEPPCPKPIEYDPYVGIHPNDYLSMDDLKAKVNRLTEIEVASHLRRPSILAELNWKETFINLIALCGKAQHGPHYKCDVAKNIFSSCIRAMVGKGFLINDYLYGLHDKPIHLASKEGCDAILSVLLEQGAEVNALNPFGESPLHMTATNEKLSTMSLLLAYSAKVNLASDRQACTPLICGAYFPKVIRLLCKNGADVNAICLSETYGPTALQKAAKGGHVEAVQVLFEQNAVMNEIDYQQMCQAIMKSISIEIADPSLAPEIDAWVSLMKRIANYVNVLLVLNKRHYHSFIIEKVDTDFIQRVWPKPSTYPPLDFEQISFLHERLNSIKTAIFPMQDGNKNWKERIQTIKFEAEMTLSALFEFTAISC